MAPPVGEGNRDWVVVGRIEGAYGVKGWVRVRSFTDPPANILDYEPWRLQLPQGHQDCDRLEMRPHGKGFVAQLAGVDDRDAAAALGGAEVEVPRDALAAAGPGEYFWSDLLGLDVVTITGEWLGQVETMMATGANDVMVLAGDRRRLIPFVQDSVVQAVDLDAREIRVDWDPDF